MVRARLVVPLVVLCALATATPALAVPHLNKVQSRKVSNLVDRWVNDLVERRDLGDAWKIAGAAERGAITRKAWVSGRELPFQRMHVRNDPRKSWYATWRDGNELGLVVQLVVGRGQNKTMYANDTTLQKRDGKWIVYEFLTTGTMRYGRGHSGSCFSSKCKVSGTYDLMPGGPASGGPLDDPHPAGAWGVLLIAGVLGAIPVVGVLIVAIVALRRSLRVRRARIAYEASRAI
jgi:hypothetical protein